MIDALFIDRHLAPVTNAFRAGLGLPPARRFLGDWLHSTDRVIGLFPDWFAPPQPDWPPRTVLSGFPTFDDDSGHPMPPEVVAFLDGGLAPVVFTFGTALRHGRRLFEASVDACLRAGLRGILLTRFADQVPADLPETIIHADYLPFHRALPRASALVHHGGVGTGAQALMAGLPQLVVPMNFDQPDNAARLKRLGVARILAPRRYRGPAVARCLAQLLASSAVASSCRSVAARFADADPLDAACRAIEGLIR